MIFVAVSYVGFHAYNPAFGIYENEVNLNQVNSDPITISLLPVSDTDKPCIRSEPCEFVITIKNVSNEDAELYGLSLDMRPFSAEKEVETHTLINSPIDINSMKNLSVNQAATKLVLPANESLERKIDIGSLGWLKSISSVWQYENLWDRTTDGKYQLSTRIGYSTKSHPSGRKEENKLLKEKIGHPNVIFIDHYSYAAKSDTVLVEIKHN